MPGQRVPYALGALIVALVLLASLLGRTPSVAQPIAFNHRKHTEDLGLACEFCHAYVTRSARAGLPGRELCSACHVVEQGESPEAAKLTRLIQQGDSLVFNKLFRLPAHVYYSHRRHVGIAGIKCETCHGLIQATERPPGRPLVKVDMDFCLGCHRSRSQSSDCVACHR